jgi:hypothetical protein
VESGWSVKRYLFDSWNIFDGSSSLLEIIWFSKRFYPSHSTVSTSIIPEALGLLRYLSVKHPLGSWSSWWGNDNGVVILRNILFGVIEQFLFP